MTGFGKSKLETNGKVISLEIRSLNSKQLDINLRIPYLYREKELELRKLIGNELVRGKVDVYLNIEQSGADSAPRINKEIAKSYFRQISELSNEINIVNGDEIMSTIIRLPEVVGSAAEELDADEWNDILNDAKKVIEKLNVFRKNEGEHLSADFKKRIETIKNLLTKVEPLEKARVPKIKERIRASINNLVEDVNVDNDRMEQEMIFYLEKLDITEEKVRLLKHCNYFLETLDGEDIVGKKLGFVCQEIGREINTLGSKANDAALQKIVVLMKDELEKIKEQLFNIL